MPKAHRAHSVALALLFLVGALFPVAARPDVPSSTAPVLAPSAQLQALAGQFTQQTNNVERLVTLYRLEELNSVLADPAQTLATLRRMADAPHLSPLLRGQIDSDIALQQHRLGQVTQAAATWRGLGLVEHWRMAGPFDNSSPAAIETAEGPEKGIDLNAHYQGKTGQVGWRALTFPTARGMVDLALYFTPSQSASAYLVSWVRSGKAQDVALRLMDSGATRVWVNGQPVFDEQGIHHGGGFDMHAVAAHLNAGWNQILVKDGATESSDWRFSVRITTPAGEPLALPSSDTPQTFTPAAGPAPKFAVADVLQEAKAAATTADGEWRYAWVLARKRSFNAGDHDASNTFMDAAAKAPQNLQILLDFAEHDSDESRRYRNLEAILKQDPHNAAALRDRGWVELDRREFWPARADFEAAIAAAGGQPATMPRAELGLMASYAGFGVRSQTLACADVLEKAGYAAAPGISVPAIDLLRRMGFNLEARRWAAAGLQGDRTSTTLALRLADLERQAGEFAGALKTLQQAVAANPDLPMLYAVEARALAGLGRGPEALAAVRQAISFDPANPDNWVAQGEIEDEFSHHPEALKSWQTALNLNPQDSSLRDRLQLARGGEQEESFEKPYLVDTAQAIAAFKAHPESANQSGPVLDLVDNTVVRIFPSGNVGRYVQQLFRVNNDTGVDSLSTYSVTYDPATEDVHYLTARVIHPDGTAADAPEASDVPINESVGYETYYDVRNKYVNMPTIRPGDFVEIAYRVMPTTLESLYGDYYGDMIPFQDTSARLWQQFIVITPKNKPLYTRAVRFSGEHSVSEVGEDRVYRWGMKNEPAFTGEPSAPPMIEQIPYLEVSSFANWNQFGRWYLHLLRDTFVLNDEMKQTTKQLIAGKTSVEDKVDAIYRYVIQNTHYVALEFGIHGYRPYPVTQVFHRRFGDCKDKASLLIAMLNYAGVPAEFVLTRTRDRGLIDPTIASVADFDHAIVYVPALHRYLDGTTEYNGAQETPDGDQRAFVLRLPVLSSATEPDPALAPVVTPELPASDNTSSKKLVGTLDAQGNLQFQMSMSDDGGDAPLLRQAMQIPERRAGVLQSMLHNHLPGISVTSATSQNETNWDVPIDVQFEGNVPRFATVDGGKTLLIPMQIIQQPWLPRVAVLPSRQYPELLGAPQTTEEEMEITLPAGYRAQPAAQLKLDAPFASVDISATNHGNVVVVHSLIVMRKSVIEPAEYPAFRKFWAQVDQVLGQPIRAVPAEAR